MSRILIATAGLALSACTAMVPSTALKLMNFSPLTADPEDLAVKIDLPQTVGIRPDSARFMIINTYQGETTNYEYVLERDGPVFRIASDDIEGLRRLQAQISAQEEATPDDNSGSLGISAGPCLTSDLASMEDRVSVSVQTAQDGPFLPLFRNQPLSALFGEGDLSGFPMCHLE